MQRVDSEREKKRPIRNGIRSSRLSTCCLFKLDSLSIPIYSDVEKNFLSLTHIVNSANEIINLSTKSVIGLEKYGV